MDNTETPITFENTSGNTISVSINGNLTDSFYGTDFVRRLEEANLRESISASYNDTFSQAVNRFYEDSLRRTNPVVDPETVRNEMFSQQPQQTVYTRSYYTVIIHESLGQRIPMLGETYQYGQNPIGIVSNIERRQEGPGFQYEIRVETYLAQNGDSLDPRNFPPDRRNTHSLFNNYRWTPPNDPRIYGYHVEGIGGGAELDVREVQNIDVWADDPTGPFESNDEDEQDVPFGANLGIALNSLRQSHYDELYFDRQEEDEYHDDDEEDEDQVSYDEMAGIEFKKEEEIMDTEITNDFYLKQLCGMTGKPYNMLPLDKFKDLKTKTEINKTFFELSPDEFKIEIPKDTEDQLREFFKNHVPSTKLQKVYHNIREEYARSVEATNQVRSRLIAVKRDYDYSKERAEIPYAEMLKTVLIEGRFSVEKIEDSTIFFKTNNDTIIKHRDEDKALDITVNMGKYLIALDFENNEAAVYPHSSNVFVEGNYHPHIDSNGGICYGNASEAVRKAWVTFDVKRILETIQLILNEYNDDSPYRDLSEFELAKQYRRIGRYWFYKAELDDNDIEYSKVHTESSSSSGKLVIRLQLYTDREGREGKIYFLDNAYEMTELNKAWLNKDTVINYKYEQQEAQEGYF